MDIGRPETPDHFQASSGFLGEKEPKAGFGGFASAPRPSPRPLEPRRSPHPAFRDLCQGGSGDPDGSLPAPLARSTLARLLLLSFLPRTLSQEIAQASCCRSFKGPEPGARTHPRVRAPLPLSLGSLCPLLRFIQHQCESGSAPGTERCSWNRSGLLSGFPDKTCQAQEVTASLGAAHPSASM